ncbi:carbohydrate ABC transporter permease [Paenibacillus sp. J5C_2022]|uniref:carbohydrate ABC transporter permease n=1 Tax=Paenibacillus sp. J5C2022 TaxID=2977129 RepID=UPI0021D07581|nr:carbohydrate ABC transporter permease [Paenibacillus sp. J5C2022]MCU6712727.1 carbohydrate ABC transporter permease [Paenibacillus sp. J5C2022]
MKLTSNTEGQKAGIFTEIIMIAFALIFLYPIFYLVTTSFKKPEHFYDPLSLPTSLYLGHYEKAFAKVDVLQGFLNTGIITFGSLILIVIVSSMAGYTIARMPHKFFQGLLLFFLSGMVIPLQTGMIPLFKLAVATHLIDTRTFLILLYTAGAIPFASFIYTGFTKSIPREMEESASMDGCGKWRTFWTIIFPLLLPATGTVFILNIYGFWNDLFSPLLFLKDPNKLTLMSQIVQFKANNQSVDYGPVFALSVIATLPLFLLFFFTQKYIFRGLVVGAVKG